MPTQHMSKPKVNQTMTLTNIVQAPITKELIKTHLPAHPTIVEAGAHIGRDTLKMSLLWPEGTIYAFEPVPDLFAQLVERTKDRSNIHYFNLALSNKTGTASLHVSSGASTAVSSLLEPYEYRQERPNVLFNTIEVPTITLDEWAKKQGVPAIDFLWLDMQGAELTVLQAAPHIRATVKAMLIEASLTERFRGNPLYNEIRAWAEEQGFKAIQQDMPKHNKINIFFCR